MIEILSFDLDDTLWDNRPVLQLAIEQLYRDLTRRHPKLTAHWSEDAFRELSVALASSVPQAGFTAVRRQHLRQVLKPLDLPPAVISAEVERWTAHYVRWRSRVRLFPGVVPMLARLSRRYRLVALTNGNADLKMIGLKGFFSDAFSADLAGVAKPDPEFFRRAARHMKVNPKSILHVGDHWQQDILAADQAGWSSLWVSNKCLPQDSIELQHFLGHISRVTQLESWLEKRFSSE